MLDAIDEIDAGRLAQCFAETLRDDLEPWQFAEVKRRNFANRLMHTDCCASHDFVDANMTMLAAFEETFGRSALPEGADGFADADLALINRAWTIATAEYLTTDLGAKALPERAPNPFAPPPPPADTAENRVRLFAINNFGTGGHPVAALDTLDFFGAAYVRQCLSRMAASERVAEDAREAARVLAAV